MCFLCLVFCSSTSISFCGMAKNHIQIVSLFSVVTNVLDVVSASSKRHDILHDKQVAIVIESLNHCELSNGQGLN